MSKHTPQEVAQKYGRKASAATEDFISGVDKVTVAPTKLAGEKLEKMKQGFLRALSSGKIKRGLDRVTLEDWKHLTKEKGGARYASGVMAAVPKMEAFMTEFLPHLDRGKAKIAHMPDTTLEENIARMTEFVRHSASFQRR